MFVSVNLIILFSLSHDSLTQLWSKVIHLDLRTACHCRNVYICSRLVTVYQRLCSAAKTSDVQLSYCLQAVVVSCQKTAPEPGIYNGGSRNFLLHWTKWRLACFFKWVTAASHHRPFLVPQI